MLAGKLAMAPSSRLHGAPMIRSSVKLDRFIVRPFHGSDSNSIWRNISGLGHHLHSGQCGREIWQSDRLPSHAKALGGLALLHLDQPQPTPAQGLRSHHRLGETPPLRDMSHAAHVKIDTARISFDVQLPFVL